MALDTTFDSPRRKRTESLSDFSETIERAIRPCLDKANRGHSDLTRLLGLAQNFFKTRVVTIPILYTHSLIPVADSEMGAGIAHHVLADDHVIFTFTLWHGCGAVLAAQRTPRGRLHNGLFTEIRSALVRAQFQVNEQKTAGSA